MKKSIITLYVLVFCTITYAQISYKEIKSASLNTTRQLKIKLPKNYDATSEKKYPIILVFDGDHLFEPISGQVDFQTYFDDMPPSIIVGLVQGNERFYDGYCDEVSGLPKESGIRFHDFVVEELLPYLDKNYNTSTFKIAVGHDLMGNFINSFLFKQDPVFQAYIALSPDLSGNLKEMLAERLSFFKRDVFYYMATSDKDIPVIRENVLQTNKQIKEVSNEYLTYYFDDFENETHYTLVTAAISKAFDKIFDIYKPIRDKELEEKIVPFKGTLDKYLQTRHDRIEQLFGITKPITDDEFQKVVDVAIERDDLESVEKIGKLAQKLYPTSSLGSYYLALYSEKTGKNKKAIKLYESAMKLNETGFITKEFIMSQVEKLNVVLDDNEDED